MNRHISGLAIGITSSILIMLFVNFERSYDTSDVKAGRVYRLAVSASIGNTKINQTYSSAVTFSRLLQDFPEIETGTKMLKLGETPVVSRGRIFDESRIYAVDSTFYNVFTVPLIHGISQKVLTEPNAVVLSRSTALKYFGTTDVVGNLMTLHLSAIDKKIDFTVSGVSEDMPVNSHFHYDMLVSLTNFPELINNKGWTANNFISYIVLKEGASEKSFEAKLKDFTRKYMGGEKFDEWTAKGNYWTYYLQPLTDIHLRSDLNGELEPNGNGTYVNIFSLISIIVLLIACINFMNLSTARSSLRAREVGIRKVVGSGRNRLVLQFLFESMLTTFIALAFALAMVEILLPYYRDLIGRPVTMDYFDSLSALSILILFGIMVGVIAGSYPAFVLSSFKPITALNNTAVQRSGRSTFRSTLVILQFSISIFLIIGTAVIYQQLNFMQKKNLGFSKEQVLVIKNPGAITRNISVFKSALTNDVNIVDVSGSASLPGTRFDNSGFRAEGVDGGFTLNLCVCDDNFLRTLRLELAKGRFFSKQFPSDSTAMVLNQQAADLLGWKDPIGKILMQGSESFHVIGVVKGFNYESLHRPIRPMALLNIDGYPSREEYISVRVRTGALATTVRHIESRWHDFAPDSPFEYSFLDRDFNNLYLNEEQTQQIFLIFASLAIFIACLGLFGLASYVAERRTKEIGVRKVLGASVGGIVVSLSKEFLQWIVYANVIAWPAAYYFAEQWLQNFAYRTETSWVVFAASGAIALVVALITVSSQAIKAATANPIEALRYE